LNLIGQILRRRKKNQRKNINNAGSRNEGVKEEEWKQTQMTKRNNQEDRKGERKDN
jgi:hypothetical protein